MTTWMNLEGLMISQKEKNKYYMLSLICGILKKNELIDIDNRLVVALGRVGEGQNW